MRVIKYSRSYIVKTIQKLGFIGLLIFLLVSLGFIVWLFLYKYSSVMSIGQRGILILFCYATLFVFYYLVLKRSKNKSGMDELIDFLMGWYGEYKVSNLLKDHFIDDNFVYIRNKQIPLSFAHAGDIDGIFVTPFGLFPLEVKFYKGCFDIDHGIFYKYKHVGAKRYYFGNKPIFQAEKAKEYINNLFQNSNMKPHVQSLVVMANGRIKNIEGQTGVYVVRAENLVSYLEKEIAFLQSKNYHIDVEEAVKNLL